MNDMVVKITQASSSKGIENTKSKNPALVVDWHAQPIAVYKWGISFGNEPGLSVGAFLQRVEELRRATGYQNSSYSGRP